MSYSFSLCVYLLSCLRSVLLDTAAASGCYHQLGDKIKAAEKCMAEISVLRPHIVNYAKTRQVYAAYRKAGYAPKFRAEYEVDILLHQTVKAAFDGLNVKKLPWMKDLQTEYAALLARKKAATTPTTGKPARKCGSCWVKANVNQILGREGRGSA